MTIRIKTIIAVAITAVVFFGLGMFFETYLLLRAYSGDY